jgi:hypothetical protein
MAALQTREASGREPSPLSAFNRNNASTGFALRTLNQDLIYHVKDGFALVCKTMFVPESIHWQ